MSIETQSNLSSSSPPPLTTDDVTQAVTPFIPNSNHSIAVHTIINNAQQSHGLLPHHKDYTQYRSYLTRRLARIRHAKPVLKTLSHGPKSKRDTTTTTNTVATTTAANKQRKGKHTFQPRDEMTIEQFTTHENFILDALYTIERSWAHSMELKTLYEDFISQSTTHSNNHTNNNRKGIHNMGASKSSSSPSKMKQHYINRMKKAFTLVNKLEKIVFHDGVCDEKTVLELKCYFAWMKGNYYCEVKKWRDACEQYATSLKLCFQIAKSTKLASSVDLKSDANTSAASLQLSDFFYSRAMNVIQPLLRYCKYELIQEGTLSNEEISNICDIPLSAHDSSNRDGGDDEYDDDGGDDEYDDDDLIGEKKVLSGNDESDDVNSEIMTTISFRGETVSIDEPNIKMSMIKVKAAKDKLDNLARRSKKKKIKASVKDAMFVELLNCYDDSVSIVSKSLKEYEGMTSGPAVNRKRFECSLLLGYFKYAKIQMLMSRNEKMVNELRSGDQTLIGSDSRKSNMSALQEDADAKYKRVEEIAHLYDALLQDAKSVVRLPGGKVEDIDDDLEDEFILQANANVLRIRALRCYYIGRMYAADTVAKYDQALALFDQAAMLAAEAAEEIAACQEIENIDELIESMASLEREITIVKVRAKASLYLANQGSNASSATSGLTLLCRLNDFDSGGKTHRIADVPPSLKPIPCKPAFFDIANNYVSELPLSELERQINHSKGSNTGGILSWLGMK